MPAAYTFPYGSLDASAQPRFVTEPSEPAVYESDYLFSDVLSTYCFYFDIIPYTEKRFTLVHGFIVVHDVFHNVYITSVNSSIT